MSSRRYDTLPNAPTPSPLVSASSGCRKLRRRKKGWRLFLEVGDLMEIVWGTVVLGRGGGFTPTAQSAVGRGPGLPTAPKSSAGLTRPQSGAPFSRCRLVSSAVPGVAGRLGGQPQALAAATGLVLLS